MLPDMPPNKTATRNFSTLALLPFSLSLYGRLPECANILFRNPEEISSAAFFEKGKEDISRQDQNKNGSHAFHSQPSRLYRAPDGALLFLFFFFFLPGRLHHFLGNIGGNFVVMGELHGEEAPPWVMERRSMAYLNISAMGTWARIICRLWAESIP
jgi:hypothetical protein